MSVLGGPLVYNFLRRRYPGGAGVPMSSGNPYAERGQSKLVTLFGPDIFEELRNKTVIDFGCGEGSNAVELAQRGCGRVIGLDIQEKYLDAARQLAADSGVAEKCVFTKEWTDPVDVVLTMDAFEHFADPLAILRSMRRLLKPNGYILVEFGPTWYHPLGGHLFSVFPWAHLILTEQTLLRWRQDFKTDGANHFDEVAGGLNQITIREWERAVEKSGLEFKSYELVPIRAARRIYCKPLREFFTSMIRARLVQKQSGAKANAASQSPSAG